MRSKYWGYYPFIFLLIAGMCLSRSHGNYEPTFIGIFTFALYLFSFEIFRSSPVVEERRRDWLARAVVLVFTLRMAHKPLLLYVSSASSFTALRIALLVGALAIAASLYFRAARAWFWTSAIALLAAHALVTVASPNPFIDVYTWITEACRYAWAGKNPYVQLYTDIYLQAEGHSYYPPTFNYPPGLLYWAMPFEALFRDFRVGYVVADAITAGAIFAIARRVGQSVYHAQTLALAWLAFPTSLFTLEQAWVDALLTMAVAWLGLSLVYRRYWAAGIALGFALGVKQYAVLVAIYAALWVWQRAPRRDAQKFFGGAATTTAVLYLPFAILNFSALYQSLVQSLLNQPRRMDSFSIVALLNNKFQIWLPNAEILILYAGAFVALTLPLLIQKNFRASQWTVRLILFCGLVFLFGKQAFCNYYQFLAGLLLLHLAIDKPGDAISPAT